MFENFHYIQRTNDMFDHRIASSGVLYFPTGDMPYISNKIYNKTGFNKQRNYQITIVCLHSILSNENN